MNPYKTILLLPLLTAYGFLTLQAQTYKIVDTGQKQYFDSLSVIEAPAKGSPFYGQDAQYNGNQPSYTNNGDGTVTDNVTGLMWSRNLDLNGDGKIDTADKLTYDQAIAYADTLTLGGYNDWRVPSIKELYSLINFSGAASNLSTGLGGIPFIDTTYFTFVYGDTTQGERIIDVQCMSSTKYVSTTMNGNPTGFGVNFADGRIKGYPIMSNKKYFIRFVRGNKYYGLNRFCDNGNSTVTDSATGLMWAKDDSKMGLNWEQALDWVQGMDSANYLGYNDWRMPDVKELQSIVDYSRSPATTNSAAIDTVFNCSSITDEGGDKDFPFYWSSTTHVDYFQNGYHGSEGDYVAFGKALGWMKDTQTGIYRLLDVHGAGAQRSDPKEGNPADYPYGRGPQGDVIRIYNYVRLVRNADITASVDKNNIGSIPANFKLYQNYPNPFNPVTKIRYSIPNAGAHGYAFVRINVYDVLGRKIAVLLNERQPPGNYEVTFDGSGFSSGVYFCRLTANGFSKTVKMICLK